MAELEEAGTGIALTLYPITSLQIGRKTSKGSILSVHIAKEAGQLVFFVNSPWCPKRSSGKDAGLWQLLSKAPRYDSPFANNSLMDRLLGEIMALEDSFCRTPRLGSGSSGGGGGSIGAISSSSGRHRRVKWRSLDAFVRRLHARRRALSHLHPPPHGLCGCVTLEVSWSDVRGLRYENELQAEANLAMEVTRVVKREYDSFDHAVHSHALRLYPATPSHGATPLPGNTPLQGTNASHASVPAASSRVSTGLWMGGRTFSGNRAGPKSPLGAAAAAAAAACGGAGAAAGSFGAVYSTPASSFAGSSRLAAAAAAADAAAAAAAAIADAVAHGDADAATREELVAFQSTRSRLSDSQLCSPPHQEQQQQRQQQAGTSQSSSDLNAWMSDSSERFSEGCSEVGLLDADFVFHAQSEGECCDDSRSREVTNGGNPAEERMPKGMVLGNAPAWLLENGSGGAADERESFLSGEPSYASCWEHEFPLYSESRSSVHDDVEADGVESSACDYIDAEPRHTSESWEEVEAKSPPNVHDDIEADGVELSACDFIDAEPHHSPECWEDVEAESQPSGDDDVEVVGMVSSCMRGEMEAVGVASSVHDDVEADGMASSVYDDVDQDEVVSSVYEGTEEEAWDSPEGWEEVEAEFLQTLCDGRGADGEVSSEFHEMEAYPMEAGSAEADSARTVHGGVEQGLFPSILIPRRLFTDSRSYCSTSSSAKQHQHQRHHQHHHQQHERQHFTSPSRTLATHPHPSTFLTSPRPHLPSPHQTRTPPTHLTYPSTLLSSPKPLLPALRAPPTTITYPDTLLLFRFTHPHLPAALADVITTDQRLLHQLESGLPAWAVFLQSCAGLSALYRPWMRPLVAYACFIVSLVTVLIGFYDLYKNIPVLQEMLARMLGPIWSVVGTWDMGTRLRYLGTILFLQNWERAFKWLSSSWKVISHGLSLLSYLLSLLLRPFQHPCSLLSHAFLLCLSKLLSTAWNLVSALRKLVTSSGRFLSYTMRPLWLLGQHTLVPVWQLLQACYLAVSSTGVAISNGCLLLYKLLSQAYCCSVLKLAHLLSSLISSRVSFLYSNGLLLYRLLAQACSSSVWRVSQLLSAQLSFVYTQAVLLGRLLGMLLHPLLLLARTLWAVGRAIILPLVQFIHLLLTPLLSALLSLLKLPLQLLRLLLQISSFLYSTFSHSFSNSLSLSLASSLKALSLHLTHLSNTLLLHLVYLSKTLVQPITYSIKALSFTFAYGFKSVANTFSYISKAVTSSLRLVGGARKLGSATKAVGQQISAAGSAVGQVSAAAGSAVARSPSSSLLQLWHNLFQKLFRAFMWIFKGVGSFVAAANRHRLSTRHYVLSQARRLQARSLQAAQHAQSTVLKYGRKLLAPPRITTAPPEILVAARPGETARVGNREEEGGQGGRGGGVSGVVVTREGAEEEQQGGRRGGVPGVAVNHDVAEEEFWDAPESIIDGGPEEGCEEDSDSEWDKFEEGSDFEDKGDEEDDEDTKVSGDHQDEEEDEEGEEEEGGEEEGVFEDARSDAFENASHGEA
ncbi:unnamed protein product [Closterium sp. NIES-64]|nr:unnamed protein product [Closterium sp. NIES-64]